MMVIFGMMAQDIICFRRDRLDKIFVEIPAENNTNEYIRCHESSQIFSDIIIPDIIVLSTLFLVSWRTILCYEDPSDSWDHHLRGLVQDIKRHEKGPDKVMQILPIIPPTYVIASLAVSIFNMIVFWEFLYDHAGDINIDGPVHKFLIPISFVGFIGFDLLYTEVITRYALECRMIKHFLEGIIYKVKTQVPDTQYKTQDDALDDVMKAHKYLKRLNKSCFNFALVLVMITTTLHTTNCIICLLHIDDNSYVQVLALVGRALQWSFLTLVPFFQAAQTNNISDKLQETGLAMYRPPKMFNGNTEFDNDMVKRFTSPITLRVKLFGFTIIPWLPYVIILLVLITLIIEPLGLRWLRHITII